MSQDNSSSSGANGSASGSDEINPNESKQVSYDSHRKLLGEKKKLQEEFLTVKSQLDELMSERKQREEAELTKKGEYQKLLAAREDELRKEREEKENLKATLHNGLKLDQFLRTLNGKVDEAFFGLINLDEIAIDPETGRPDPASVQTAARNFEKTYGKVIERPSGVKMPNEAPGSASVLTYEEWLKLPPKEMKSRMKEVMR